MKRLFLLFTLTTILAGTMMAQDYKFGVKGSFSLNKIFSDNIPNFNNDESSSSLRFGTQSGVYGAYVLKDDLQIGAELLYGYQGYKIKGNYEHLAMGLNYINIPIYAKYYFTDDFAAELGPQIGYCLGGNYKHSIAGHESKVDLPSDSYNKIDLSITAGLNYDMESITLWARYAYGFVNIFKDNTDGMTEAQAEAYRYYYPNNAHNSVFSIGLAYRILR